MKNKGNNNDTEADLLSAEYGVKPIASSWATAAQIVSQLPFLAGGVDETFLRNRAREINPRTAAPWIPKPRNNHYAINPTLLGLLEWFFTRAAAAGELPAAYDSMSAMAQALGIEKRAIGWLTENGAGEARLTGSRIAPRPVIKRAFDIIGQIEAGNVTGIDGLEEWNKDTELAKKLRLESDKLTDEALIREGNKLLARDGKFAIEKLLADELIWDLRDQPLRAAIVKLDKALHRQHKNILAQNPEASPADLSRQLNAATTAAVQELLAKLRNKIPPAKIADKNPTNEKS